MKHDLPQRGKWYGSNHYFVEKTMSANPDFKDLFVCFNEEKVEYLVVGAHAVIYYAEPRYTKDLDIWVNPSPENAARVIKALKRFGAPMDNAGVGDFQNPEMIYQIGIAPNRIDILMGIAGVVFSSVFTDKTMSTYDGVPVPIIGKKDLIASKKASARPQDLLDVERLIKS